MTKHFDSTPTDGEKRRPIKVRDTEVSTTDTRQQYREKIARITLDSMVQFVGLLDAEGTVLEINHVALNAVGISLAQVEGRPFWTTFWWQVSDEINATLRDCIARAAKGEFVRWDTPIYGQAGGKETIIIDASLAPVTDQEGKVVFICAEGRDITQKKAQEREIAEKNAELQALLVRVQELDEIKTQFFANVSHELRTPLQLIIGPADRLLRAKGSEDPALRVEAARVISRNARMLLKQVNDLLDIAKFEAGKLKVELEDADIAALVRVTASHFEVLAAERKLEFQVHSPATLGAFFDVAKVQRIVMNLLSNAFKFTPEGGRIRIEVIASADRVMVTVDDSGPGIKPEIRKTIFERFRQGDGASNRKFGGTGLGLAIAKEFAEMHKGSVKIGDSALGGARFTLELPSLRSESASRTTVQTPRIDASLAEGYIEELRTVAALPAPVSSEGKKANASKPTVLVVEDNPEMNRFIVETLAPDYNILAAFDGAQGLEMALAKRPTLIVTDIMMPNVSGSEMIAAIRQRRELVDIPILILTAKADEDLKVHLLENGAQDYVAKPFSERDLSVRVRNLIALRKSEDRNRTLFESMDEGYCTIEVSFDDDLQPTDFHFIDTNAAFQRQSGLSDVRGRSIRQVAPELERSWMEIYSRIALTGEPARFENEAAPLGRWFEVYAFRVGLPENRQVAIFFSDITERKRVAQSLDDAREKLARTNEELEQRVETRTKSLREAVGQMEEFSYTISHDLRAPLRSIQLYANVLMEDRADWLKGDAEAADYLKRISSNAARLDRLVRDLLTYTRVARTEFAISPVNLGTLIRNLIEHYPEMRAPKATVTVENLPDVMGHEPSLSQVFSNLLANAVKFVPATRQPKVRVWSESADGAVKVWIEDNGIGIEPELQPRLFRMFERMHPDLEFEGTGVGLAIVKKALERMSGSVGVESDGKSGSRFWVTLPPADNHPKRS